MAKANIYIPHYGTGIRKKPWKRSLEEFQDMNGGAEEAHLIQDTVEQFLGMNMSYGWASFCTFVR
jgi:hypothetical protein